PIGDEEAGGRGWGERDCDDELRIVREPRTFGRGCPGPIEDELALAVVLEVRRNRSNELTLFPKRQMVREPAGVDADARRELERLEPSPSKKGRLVAPIERVPRRLGDLADRAMRADLNRHPALYSTADGPTHARSSGRAARARSGGRPPPTGRDGGSRCRRS